ncbi:MAG: Crp/Fnr family transcriptional regulator [Synechococcales cyanobacterium]
MPAYEIAYERRLLEDLYRGRHLVSYKLGQLIPLHADELVLVCRGIVQLGTVHSNGDEALLGLVGAGVPLGLSLTLLNPYYAKAVTAVDVLRITLDDVERDPDIAGRLWKPLVQRIRQSEALLALTGKRRVSDRLHHFLELLAMEHGQPTEEGTRLGVRLTHQDIASAIGTTRVTVTRLLNQWRQEGLITLDSQRHLILPQHRS